MVCVQTVVNYNSGIVCLLLRDYNTYPTHVTCFIHMLILVLGQNTQDEVSTILNTFNVSHNVRFNIAMFYSLGVKHNNTSH